VAGKGEQAKGVVIAYDRRFASEHFAIAAAEVLLAHDIPVAYASHAVPTQMSSYEVVERGSAAGASGSTRSTRNATRSSAA
jgi:phosphomannomutase